MKKSTLCYISLLLVVYIIICGCYAILETIIINNTGERIIVFSFDSKKMIQIDNNKSERISHYSGSILVTTDSRKIWHYQNLSPDDFWGTRYSVKKHHLFGGRRLIVNFLIDKDGKIYVITPVGEHNETHKLKQPPGFPLIPK